MGQQEHLALQKSFFLLRLENREQETFTLSLLTASATQLNYCVSLMTATQLENKR